MYFLFDIGGTNMRVGISSDKQSIKTTKIIPTPQDFEQGMQALQLASEELASGEKIEGVAGGIAGLLDKDKSMLISSPHIQGWAQKPLKSRLNEIFNCEVFLENDTALEGLGEAIKGAGAGKNIVAYISIGTGIGGVRIVEGKIDRNALGFEPGHQIIVIDGNPCSCGGKGHLETYVGGSYLEKIYQQKGEEITNPQIWNEVAKYLSIGLTNVAVFWSPDIIILGGSVSRSIPLDIIQANLKECLTIFPNPPQLTLGSLSHDAGLYGALNCLK